MRHPAMLVLGLGLGAGWAVMWLVGSRVRTKVSVTAPRTGSPGEQGYWDRRWAARRRNGKRVAIAFFLVFAVGGLLASL